MARLRDRREAAGPMTRLALLLVSVAALAAPALGAAQQTTKDAQEAEPESPARAGLERRQTLPPPGPIPPAFSVNGALRGGVQWIVNPARAKDDVFGFGAFDLVLIGRPTPNVTLLADVEAIAGPGPDAALGSLSLLNAETTRLSGDDPKVFLREAWIRLQSDDASTRFTVGKLAVPHYFDRNFFAEDETRQFLNAALVGNPLLGQPRNGPGTSLRISQGDWRYAFGVHAPGDVDDDLSGLPYLIAELGRRHIFALAGHYRWWARVGSVPERRDDVTWGTGISVDQLVAAGTGVFVRAGLARREGESLTSHAWSAGGQHTPSWLRRAEDLMGGGCSIVCQPQGRGHVAEGYYNVSLADLIRRAHVRT